MQKKRGKKHKKQLFSAQKNKGQVTIFIILAVIIVAGVSVFLLLRGNISIQNVPANMQPVYSTFTSCLEENALLGIKLLESQGGYIELPEFEAGSSYMPFSSQLNFIGNPIPYWSYVSGNNIQKEQVPTVKAMGNSISTFVEDRIRGCDFGAYYDQGFEIFQEKPTVTVEIQDEKVVVNLAMNMKITRGDETFSKNSHRFEIKSSLGKLYKSAKIIYDKENKELFLEKYGIDTMRLYAPVDGTELTCSPKIWDARKFLLDCKMQLK